MSFFSDIFGGSETRQKQQSSGSSKPVDLTPSPFKDLQSPLSEQIMQFMGGGLLQGIPTAQGSGGLLSSGTTTAATTETPEAQTLRDFLMADASGATGRQDYTQAVLSGKYLPGQEGANPFYNQFYQAAARPFTEEYEQTVGRLLPSQFLQAGQLAGSDSGSSAFDRARAVATRGYASSLSDLAAKLGFETYDAERGRQQQAVQLSQADTDLMIKSYEAQLMPTFIAQFGVEQGLKEYQTRIQAALEILRTAANVTQPTIAQDQQQQSSGTSKTESSTGVIPALGSILSINR